MANGQMIGQTYTYTDNNGKQYKVAYGDHLQNYNLAKQASDDAAALKKQQMNETLAQNNQQTNSNYDNSARQAYVKYMQNKKSLPSSLSALGVRGGASETALMNLYNNYGSSQASNNAARNAELASNQQNYNDTWNAYEADRQATLNSQLQEALTNQQNQYNNEITQFSASVHQFPSTSAGYKKYQSWISALSKSSDPLKDIKIGLIRQQMATQFPNGAPSSGGSGSGRSSGGYSGGGSGGDNYSSVADAVKATTDISKNIASAITGSKNNNSTKNAYNRLINWRQVRG